MKTIKFVVTRPDWNNHPQYVWGNKKPTPYGRPSKGKWYDGFRIVRFADEDSDLIELRKLAKRVHGKLERWEYESNQTRRFVVYDFSIQVVLEMKRKNAREVSQIQR